MVESKIILNKPNIKIYKILERTGILLKVYKSGKIPKILKIIPLFKNFEDIIWFTRPDRWTFQALFVVSKVFSRNLNNSQLKRFYSLIILPRLQECILKNEKISSHIHLIIRLARLDTKTFFSSILLPLFTSLSCTKKEAVVFSIIIMKISVQPKHIAWTLIQLLKTSQNSSKYIIIRVILSKNYNFSYRIMDNLVDYFVKNQEKINNVYFLKCYITFLEKYYQFLSLEDKNRLPNLL
nr:bystin-like protein [Cryptomonas sp.]